MLTVHPDGEVHHLAAELVADGRGVGPAAGQVQAGGAAGHRGHAQPGQRGAGGGAGAGQHAGPGRQHRAPDQQLHHALRST